MKKDIEHLVCTCVKCENPKSISEKKYELYRPLVICNEPWESVSMHFMTQLPEWNGMDIILIIIDQFSKLVENGSNKYDYNNFPFSKIVL
jgi:hypothetical protein